MNRNQPARRKGCFVPGVLAVLMALGAGHSMLLAKENKKEVLVRLSYFRPSIPATVQKSRGTLEQKLAPLGASVQWHEFKVPTDSTLALASGAIDIMVGGVEGSISAISKGVPMLIVATGPHQPPKTGWYTALLVPDNSPIKTLADLKGKKIAVGKGGFSEAILALAVRRGGLNYPKDVQPVYLTTPDGSNACKTGRVDAFLTLDPYIPFTRRDLKSRALTDNKQLGYPTIWGVAVNKKFAEAHPGILKVIVEEFSEVGSWVKGHPVETSMALAKEIGFEQGFWETAVGRASYLLESPGSQTLPDVQQVADQLLELGVIRERVEVAENVWKSKKENQ